MVRRISVLAALTMLLVFSTLFSAGATAPSCGSACVQNHNFCKSTCNGNAACLAQCQDEYECCQIICHGGTCRQGKKRGGDASALNKAR